MERVIFLFLRRMRAPLITLILAYAISMTGLVLIPGVDDQGQVWHVDFFHAFYFVSFMGSTIGFGELPYEFTAGQRMWVVLAIYLTVLSWLYAIGKIFALLQDPAFVRALTEARFIYAVRKITEPFLVVCGYGETGSLLVRALSARNIRCVVIDRDPEHINDLQLEELGIDIPAFCGDASETEHLREAGLAKPNCAGVIAVTDSDDVNVKIAVTTKLLKPRVPVVCRASSREAMDNMSSFQTDHIINPFEAFAEHLGMAIRTPSINQLHRWLVARAGRELQEPVLPPKGLWVICGFGRFGQAVARYLRAEDIDVRIIEQDAENAPEGAVIGSGTDYEPLHEAGIEQAAGIVAGTDNGANNLSIIMTAREINPALYLVARQDRRADTDIFEAARIDLIMEPSRIIVWRILPLVTIPLLAEFLAQVRRQTEDWAQKLLHRIQVMTHARSPQVWAVAINEQEALAVHDALCAGAEIRLGDLLRAPRKRDERLNCIPLLLQRGDKEYVLPEDGLDLQVGDRLLFCATPTVADRMSWLLQNRILLRFALSGEEPLDSALLRWLAKRRRDSRRARLGSSGG